MESSNKQYDCALEVGAGALSSLSPFLATISEKVECSFYDKNSESIIKQNNLKICERFNVDHNDKIKYSFQDIMQLKGKYDLIVIKSVSGGVFRNKQSSLEDYYKMIDNIVANNLNVGGELYLLENGRSYIHPLTRKFGSRANAWRFFEYDNFKNFDRYYSFGVLAAFSLATRLGVCGLILEDVIYYIDILLSRIFKKHTVHVVVYRNDKKDF